MLLETWSGRRDSNPRRPAWEAGILPLNYSRTGVNSSHSTSIRRNPAVASPKTLTVSNKLA